VGLNLESLRSWCIVWECFYLAFFSFLFVCMVSREDVLNVLKNVVDPELKADIVSLGFVRDVSISEDGVVVVRLELTTPACPFRVVLEKNVREVVSKIPGVRDVVVKIGAQVPHLPSVSEKMLGVKNVIAVASGKGGVGKSTIAVNLALSLALKNASVGLLDADVYGPTIPKMLDVIRPPFPIGGDKIEPGLSYLKMKVMSMGMLIPEEAPVIWRGPLVAKAVQEMLERVEWGDLDYLVVDLPPGTGDAPLTLAQTIPLTGVVIVTTPQEAALRIALKSLRMFMKLNVEIIGIIENMSYFICPNCGTRTEIFGYGNTMKVCRELNIPLLGEVPLAPEVRESGDTGRPIVIRDPDSPVSKEFLAIAERVAGRVSVIVKKKLETESKKEA